MANADGNMETTTDSLGTIETPENIQAAQEETAIPSFDENYKDAAFYPNDEGRIALIVNNKRFNSTQLFERKGTDTDATALRKCFEDLGFDCRCEHNLTAKRLMEILVEIKNYENINKKASCFVCIILTYGHDGVIYCVDSDYKNPVEMDTILTHFKSNECTGLAGKPKLFFIQACDVSQLTEADGEKGDEGQKDEPMKIPNEADILMHMCKIPGFHGWGTDEKKGSWFGEALTEIFTEHYKENSQMDVLRMLTRVNNKILKKIELKNKPNKLEIPCVISTLTKKLIFPPKKLS